MHLASEHRGIRNEVRVRLWSVMQCWSRSSLMFTACAGHTLAVERTSTKYELNSWFSQQTYMVVTCSVLCCCCCCGAVAVGIVEDSLVHHPWMPMLPVCARHIHAAGLQDAQSSPGAPARCGVCCLTCESQLNSAQWQLAHSVAACLACRRMSAAVDTP